MISLKFKASIVLIGAFFLFSCSVLPKKSIKKNILESEARCSDIPLPLGLISLKELEDGFEYQLLEKSQDAQETIEDFYNKNMEIYGWRLFVKHKDLLIYEKPYKIVLISKKINKKNIIITIKIVNKFCNY